MTATDSSVGNSYDAVVVGGGPAGSTVATLLAQHGLRVAIFERARFPRFEPDKVVVQVSTPQGTQQTVQARLLVDASGRSALLGGTLGQRELLPDLGKVALFAHFQGAQRDSTIPDGNIRIHLVRDGWI